MNKTQEEKPKGGELPTSIQIIFRYMNFLQENEDRFTKDTFFKKILVEDKLKYYEKLSEVQVSAWANANKLFPEVDGYFIKVIGNKKVVYEPNTRRNNNMDRNHDIRHTVKKNVCN